MQVRAARQVAARWLFDQWLPSTGAGAEAAFGGAFIMGSLAAKVDDDVFDEAASDIDIAIVVDPSLLPLDRERYPHGKFLVHEGCAIQAIFLPSPLLEDEETLLTMLGLGCNLRYGHILSDPHRKLTMAQEFVLGRWAEPEASARRVERAGRLASEAVQRLTRVETPVGRLNALCEVASQPPPSSKRGSASAST